MLLAVNYHYVAEERSPDARAIFPVTTGGFAAQLDELGRSFEFVSRDDVIAAVDGGRTLPERCCLVTFDDGLREQVELAVPVLEERGIPAVFFVCGRPLAEGGALYVHRVHHLRETVEDADLLAALGRRLQREGIELEDVPTADAVAMYRYDTPEAARLKYLLNVVLGPSRPELIEAIFAEHFSEAEFCERLYMSADQVEDLERAGALGAHGYSHSPLAVLEPGAVRRDLERGADVLEQITGVRPRALSYPYGTASAVDRDVAREAAAAGYAFALTMERAINLSLDEPLLLARVSANDAPGGSDPLFSFEGSAVLVRGGMTAGRARYMEEVAA